ncbi:MAG: hypothetical protein AB7G93_19240 [Bdellovibrionales bacterium]
MWTKLGDLYWVEESGQREVLAAASGLIRLGDFLWITADDLHHLIQVPLDGSLCGQGHRIFPGDLPAGRKARKRVKPDTEALIHIPWNNQALLVALPSGSKPHRIRGAVVILDSENRIVSVETADFSSLLQALDQRVPDLNIEGGAVWNDKLVLLQRGNGKAGFNGVVELDLASFISAVLSSGKMEHTLHDIREVQLPELSGVRLTFTDAETVNGTLYFSAAAEGGKDTYLDGTVTGSAVGCLDKHYVPKIRSTVERHKAEGLALSRAEGHSLEFFVVTDADDPLVPSHLFKVLISSRAVE